MLLNDFFHIHELQVDGADIKALFTINAGHAIFNGHFPGQPVVPGVCMLQMIKEALEQVTGKSLNLTKAHDMKFLAVIDPRINNSIQAQLKYAADESGNITVNASLFKDELVHFKFKGQFGFQQPD